MYAGASRCARGGEPSARHFPARPATLGRLVRPLQLNEGTLGRQWEWARGALSLCSRNSETAPRAQGSSIGRGSLVQSAGAHVRTVAAACESAAALVLPVDTTTQRRAHEAAHRNLVPGAVSDGLRSASAIQVAADHSESCAFHAASVLRRSRGSVHLGLERITIPAAVRAYDRNTGADPCARPW